MKAHFLIIIFIVISSMFVSCSKNEKENDPALVGTWNVTQVEGQQFINNVQGIYLADNNPTGYVQFEANGRGKQNYSFTLFGTTYPQNSSFRWTSSNTSIIVKGNDEDLVWNRIVNEKDIQKVSYNIQMNTTTRILYTLTLEKQ